MNLKNIPREKINWFPTIDKEKCIGCQECFNFCSHGVYEWDDGKNQPKVVNPYNCVVGCSNCSNLCKQEAIIFPTLRQLKEMIEKAKSSK